MSTSLNIDPASVIDQIKVAEPNVQRAAISNYLRNLVEKEERDWLTDVPVMPIYKKKDGSPVSGAEVGAIVEKCIAGKDLDGCVNAWAALNLKEGVDVTKMDVAMATSLLQTLGVKIHQKDAYASWKADNGSKLALNADLEHFIKALIQRVLVPNASSPDLSRRVIETSRIGIIPARVGLTSISGVLVGAGRSRLHSEIVQMNNYMRNQINMVGGNAIVQFTSGVRSSYNELVRVLEAKGKKIDPADDLRIRDSIESLQRSEGKVKKAALYINGLIQLVKHPKFNVSEITTDITAKMLEELTQKHQALLTSTTKKATNLISILESINNIAGDMTTIKNDVAELKTRIPVASAF